MQNHLLQVLCLLAMEPPARLGERELRDRKVDVLRSVRAAPTPVATRRARYTAGARRRRRRRDCPRLRRRGRRRPERGTETFAEVSLELDSERWAGTRFVLRAGKALSRRRKAGLVRFRLRRPARASSGSASTGLTTSLSS